MIFLTSNSYNHFLDEYYVLMGLDYPVRISVYEDDQGRLLLWLLRNVNGEEQLHGVLVASSYRVDMGEPKLLRNRFPHYFDREGVRSYSVRDMLVLLVHCPPQVLDIALPGLIHAHYSCANGLSAKCVASLWAFTCRLSASTYATSAWTTCALAGEEGWIALPSEFGGLGVYTPGSGSLDSSDRTGYITYKTEEAPEVDCMLKEPRAPKVDCVLEDLGVILSLWSLEVLGRSLDVLLKLGPGTASSSVLKLAALEGD
ncbi:hypothetical protein ACLOJK_007774 [Asimina triloba]